MHAYLELNFHNTFAFSVIADEFPLALPKTLAVVTEPTLIARILAYLPPPPAQAQAQDGHKEEGAENSASHGVIKAPTRVFGQSRERHLRIANDSLRALRGFPMASPHHARITPRQGPLGACGYSYGESLGEFQVW